MRTIKITLHEAEDAAVLDYIEPLIAQGGRGAAIVRHMLHRCVAREMDKRALEVSPGAPSSPELVLVNDISEFEGDEDRELSSELDNLF